MKEPEVGEVWLHYRPNLEKHYYLILERIGIDPHGNHSFKCIHLQTGIIVERNIWPDYWKKVAP